MLERTALPDWLLLQQIAEAIELNGANMNHLTQSCIAFCLLTLTTVVLADEPIELPDPDLAPSPPPDSAALDETDGELDELDQLLAIAENDTAQLGEVSVVTPALEEVVSTVSRQKSTVGKSPAAVFVITNEMIRRSGARSVPEVLRMAPGVQVNRIDANKWSVGIRGSANRFTNSLLVQIDGRSVYTPLFAGVFWDVQDVLLEDVERIEVIRGPGATVWGANAVDGVINIITRSSKETQGVFVESGGGSERAFTSARVGGQLGENGTYRIFGKWYERDTGGGRGFNPADDSRMGHGGLRLDWLLDSGVSVTVQGDLYDGASGTRQTLPAPLPAGRTTLIGDEQVVGGNLLTRLSQAIGDDSDWSLQVYYDRTERSFTHHAFQDERDMFDIDFQYHSNPWVDHSIICGVAYRYHQDSITNSPFFLSFTPNKRSFDLVSGFVQDEITLLDNVLTLTAGSKFEHNDFTGFEFQPSVRLLWTPDETHSAWAAVSRAVRTPSRFDDNGRLTLPGIPIGSPAVFPIILGDRASESEDLLAYELGFREQVTDEFAWDLAAFFHDYDDQHIFALQPPGFMPPEGPIAPQAITNSGSHQSYGCELSTSWNVTPSLQVFGTYMFLRTTDDSTVPHNRLYVQSSWDVTESAEFDTILRYVDKAPGTSVNHYLEMDLRFSWQPTEYLELFVVGRNLLDRGHEESTGDTTTGTAITNVEREVFAGAAIRY